MSKQKQDEHLLHVSVSNQSFAKAMADLDVRLDNRQVFHQQMTTGTQHNWASVTIAVSSGEHTLMASEVGTQTREIEVVNVDRELWIVVTFHSPPEQIRIETSEHPVAFM